MHIISTTYRTQTSNSFNMFVSLFVGLCLLSFTFNAFAQESLVVGVPPFSDPEKLALSFQPFTDYLAEATGLPATLKISESYEEFADDVVTGKIALGFSTTVLYVQTKEKFPEQIHYLATCMQEKGGKSRAHYYGFFLVNADSPYKSLADLEGKKWGFTQKSSSSGYQYPIAFFERKGLDPERYFSEVKFLEKHPKVTDALAAWEEGADNIIDGGATWDVNLWEAEETHGKVFKKIARVGPIPLQPMVVSQDVAQNVELLNAIKEALKNVPDAVLQTEGFLYSGWKFGRDKDFDITRKVVGIAVD